MRIPAGAGVSDVRFWTPTQTLKSIRNLLLPVQEYGAYCPGAVVNSWLIELNEGGGRSLRKEMPCPLPINVLTKVRTSMAQVVATPLFAIGITLIILTMVICNTSVTGILRNTSSK